MPVGAKQRLITSIVSKVLGEPSQTDKKFAWFINQHTREHFQNSYDTINDIYSKLNGNNVLKRVCQLQSDAYFGGKYNFLFEFDEFQHFSTARLNTFNFYPKNLKMNYSIVDWKNYCLKHSTKADRYRYGKTASGFYFAGGRTCQRAYLDCFRDLLPQHNGLNPTLRISDFEVLDIRGVAASDFKTVERLLKDKLKYI